MSKLPSFTGAEIYELLTDMRAVFEEHGWKPIILDENASVGEGTAKFDPGAPWRVNGYVVGVKELVDDPDKKYSAGDAMFPIVSFCHEVCGHGGQVMREFRKQGSLQSLLALNYFACKGSGEYYDGNNPNFSRQYRHQPHEIAAQYMGIKALRTLLTAVYGEENKTVVDGMLRQYVIRRARKNSEFIRFVPLSKDMDGILESFDNVFYNNVNRHREYRPKRAGPDALHTCHYSKEEERDASIEFVRTCENGICQDMAMTWAFLRVWDSNGHVRNLAAFRDLELDHDSVFVDVDRTKTREEIALSQLGDTMESVASEIKTRQDDRKRKAEEEAQKAAQELDVNP